MKLFGFEFKFNTEGIRNKVSSVIGFIQRTVNNVTSKVKSVDISKIEDVFREGAAKAINKSGVNYTPRMEDILNGWHIREISVGLGAKRTFEIYHSFLEGGDKRYSVTIRKKEFRTYGKRILLSLEKGRRDYWIVPKVKGRNRRLVWGYPTLRNGTSPNQRVAKAVYVPKMGMYDKGIGMIKRGKERLLEYFRSRNISVNIQIGKGL